MPRSGRSRAVTWLGDIVVGVAIALGQAPFDLVWVALAGLAGLLWRCGHAHGWRGAGWTAWRIGAAYFAVSLHWIVEPFLVDVPRHGWMAPFALVLMSGGLALFWGAAGMLSGVMRRDGPGQPIRAMLVFAVALTSVELARSYVLTGFPWALIGTIWIDTPLAQTVALFGLHGLGLASLLALVAGFAVARRAPTTFLRYLGGTFVTTLCLGVLAGPGFLQAPAPEPASTAPFIRLVQPNAAQHLKWDPDMVPVFLDRQIELSRPPTTAPRPDLVIWPETAIAYRLERAGPLLARIAESAGGAPVVLGAVRRPPEGPTNTLAVIDPTGTPSHIYDKAHLVPFGEYIPFGEMAARFGLRGLAARDGGGFHAGPGPVLLDLGKLGTVLPLICYEAIFPNFGRTETLAADWMLQITNDAWFGQFAGPQQHLVLARFRAIERGLPLLRAANTGISAVIDAHGVVRQSLPLDVIGTVEARLPPRLAPPLYARMGDVPIGVMLGVLLLFFFGVRSGERN